MRAVDVHQHLWPEELVALLARRSTPPRLNGSTLQLAEGRYDVDLAVHDLAARVAKLDRYEVDVAIVSLQPTLGLGSLPSDERDELVGAWEQGIRELVAASGGRLVALAAGGEVDGFAGACVGAPALLDLDGLAPLIDALVRSGGFMFVHPSGGHTPTGSPPWWPAVVDYPAQMQSAYLAWLAHGQERWPELHVVFAILAGGGPFQLERLASRGVDVRSALHRNVYFDTASYGRRALELCIETFGVEQLVYGSDFPVVDPAQTLHAVRGFGDSITRLVCYENPTRLLA